MCEVKRRKLSLCYQRDKLVETREERQEKPPKQSKKLREDERRKQLLRQKGRGREQLEKKRRRERSEERSPTRPRTRRETKRLQKESKKEQHGEKKETKEKRIVEIRQSSGQSLESSVSDPVMPLMETNLLTDFLSSFCCLQATKELKTDYVVSEVGVCSRRIGGVMRISPVLHGLGGASVNLRNPFVVVQGSETEMVREELVVRLNDREYKNWLKAGRCLLILKDGLLTYTDQQIRSLHADLLNQNSLLRSPCLSSSCRPRGNKLSSPCRPCSEWQKVILMHHRHPDGTINWANCSPPLWRTDHWELAKAYMPRGQAQVKGPDQCDASALLNLISYCKWFSAGDPKSARQVIQCRNELMHSSEFKVKGEWMKNYSAALQHFVQQFSHIPGMTAVGRQIEDMLAVDLSICVFGEDQTDSACIMSDSIRQLESSAEVVSQWEAALLQEMLQECLHAAPDSEEANAQDAQLLKGLGCFLRSNKDLGERFSTELQTITKLEARE